MQSDYIKNNKLFLNAVQATERNIQIVTQQIAKNQDIEYIDGSVLHKVVFTVFDYKSISFNQFIASMGTGNQNVDSLLEAGNIINFVEQMEKEQNYPDFGEKFEVQKIYCAYSTPSTPSVDSSISPALAKYSIPIVCEVLEYGD